MVAIAVRLLMVVALGIAAVQFWLSNTTPLSRWKGGGYGMYTEPHANDRTVWALIDLAEGRVPVRLFPVSAKATSQPLPTDTLRSFRKAERLVDRLRFYPRDSLATTIAAHLSSLNWAVDTPGPVAPSQGSLPRSLAIEVHESGYDISEQRAISRTIYTWTSTGAGS